jgi:hypothetical protein
MLGSQLIEWQNPALELRLEHCARSSKKIPASAAPGQDGNAVEDFRLIDCRRKSFSLRRGSSQPSIFDGLLVAKNSDSTLVSRMIISGILAACAWALSAAVRA